MSFNAAVRTQHWKCVAACRPMATESKSLLMRDTALPQSSHWAVCSCLIWFYYPSSLQRILFYPDIECETEKEKIAAGALCRCIVFFWAFLGLRQGFEPCHFWTRWYSCYAEISGGRQLRGNRIYETHNSDSKFWLDVY